MAHSTSKKRLRWFQFRLRAVLLLTALIAVGLTAWRVYFDPVEQKVRAVLRATNPSSASAAYRQLFEACGASGLAYLKRHGNDSIAIQAAWEEVELTVPVEFKGAGLVRPDPTKLASFLRFLETRARIQAPKWWADILLNAEANCRYNITFYRWPHTAPEYQQAGADDILTQPGTVLKSEGGELVLQVGPDSAVIPKDLLRGGWRNKVSALMTSERCYIAVHGDGGYGFELTCIDRVSARIRWQSDVWGHFWGYINGVPSDKWVTITEQDNRIIVFGATSGGIHVEAFRSDDGENVFRFSNAY
jgi:hypothetical protein